MFGTSFNISIFDPFWQFPLPNVVLYATHQENKRLFGFVLRTSGGRVESRQTSVCYIFESNNEGEKVLVMVMLVSVLNLMWILRCWICSSCVRDLFLWESISFMYWKTVKADSLSTCKCFNMLSYLVWEYGLILKAVLLESFWLFQIWFVFRFVTLLDWQNR